MLTRFFLLIVLFIPTFAYADFFTELAQQEVTDSKPLRLFSIHGSNTINAEMAPNLLKQWFMNNHLTDIRVRQLTANEQLLTARLPQKNIRVEVLVTAHGSGTGYKYMQQGAGDIAASSRPINAKELALLQAHGDMRSLKSEHIVAIDGLAIIVNPLNPLTNLDLDALADIFSGEITNWSELGGDDAPIRLYARDENSGTWDSFKSLVLGNETLASALRFESNAELSDRVAVDPYGIGFVGLTAVRESKLLAVYDGESQALSPNALNVATEDYVLARRLYMYSLPNAVPAAQAFIQFVLSDAGQQVVEHTGFIAQTIKAVIPDLNKWPSTLRDLVKDAKRLTVNFRFAEGSARLDNKALLDIERLVEYMRQHPQQQLMLIGYGDPQKSEARSQLLSKLRAMTVRRELAKAGIYPEKSLGVGDDILVADTDDDSRVRNRRVEVWVH